MFGCALFEWEKGLESRQGWHPTMEKQMVVCWMPWLLGSGGEAEKMKPKRKGEKRM